MGTLNPPQGDEHARVRKAWQDAGLLDRERPRRATPEQTRTYREAHKDLWRQGEYEQRAGLPREETPVSARKNDRAAETAKPLTRFQERWHFQRALFEHDRDWQRRQDASDAQDRDDRNPRIEREARARERALDRQDRAARGRTR